ncbi:MAG: protein kinase [Pirellulales bacterium]|nr:protein kinase [Pirellulales bacterium]
MLVCPSCQTELDEASRLAGRCGSCGARLPVVPQRRVADRTIAEEELAASQGTIDGGALAADDPGRTIQGAGEKTIEFTVDLDSIAASVPGEDVGASAEDDSLHTLELSDSTPACKPGTVELRADATIEFSSTHDVETDAATMLTSQWEAAVAEGGGNSGVTIRQKDTIVGKMASRSSIVVKSRSLAAPGEKKYNVTIASPDDAPDYELLDVLGEGGMGVVYSARQSSIARTVAVKMLKGAGEKSDEQRDKFISEAVVTGELDHPNIVPIYDLGSNKDGALFYSMKKVKGTPWNKVIAEQSLDDNLNILLRVADAVAFAHANGVIHRDLKPENIMLGDYGEVLVMDWGLARISPEFPGAGSVSQSNAMGGTPAYMAPEMASGPIDSVTASSDVYLLGAILFEIVSGRPPHTGKTVMDCLLAAAKNKIVAVDAGGELMEIARHAMATKPEDRYASVRAMQDAIRTYQSHSESIVLTDSAAKTLAAAEGASDYEPFARSMYALEEALELWRDNRRAEHLLVAARQQYAELALAKGDLDLGLSLVSTSEARHAPVVEKLQQARAERESRKRRIKLLKGAVAALAAAVVVIGSGAYVAVRRERNEAFVQRDRAVKAEGEAKQNYLAAEEARGKESEQRQRAEKAQATAESERDRANTERERAETEKERAEAEKVRADAERDRAVAAEADAVDAREQEEYAAYVARIGLASAKIEENAFARAKELLAQCPEDLRGFEWGRLNQLCRLAMRAWDLQAPVDAVDFAPDGRHFAAGGWDGAATIWSTDDDEPLVRLPQGQYVHAVAYDPSGERLAAASSDGAVNVYRTADGKLVARLVGHEEAVLCVRFSPDGSQLATGGYDDTVRLWDAATGKELQTLRGHSWWIWAAEFSPDGLRLVTAGQDGKAIVWRRDAATDLFTPLTEFTKHRGAVYAAKFAPDGRRIATAGYDGRVLSWSPDEVEAVDVARRIDRLPDPAAPFVELTGHRGPVRALAFAPDGTQLASGGQDNTIVLWDLAGGAQLKRLRGHSSHVRALAFAPDGGLLLSGGRGHEVMLWNPATYAEARLVAAADPAQRDAVLAARFSTDGRQIVTAGRDRKAELWDAKSLARMRQFAEGHDFLASSATFFAGGAQLATGAGDGTVRLWDVGTGAETSALKGAGRTAALAATDDGALVATGSPAGSALVWNARTGKRLAELPGHDAEVTAVAFSPDGLTLAAGDERGHAQLWRLDPATGRWQSAGWLRGHSRTITAMAFYDGGRRLATASGDNTCGVWNVATRQELRELALKHPGWVSDLVVSADGAVALTGCDDGALRLWSLADGKLLRTVAPPRNEAAITAVDLSPDGDLALAVCAAEGTVRLWNLTTGSELSADDAGGSRQAWLSAGRRGGVVWAARFAPDGRGVLAIGGNDARLYDLADRTLRTRFSSHGVVASADLSPDGSRVVTGSWDRTAKIWDAATGRVVAKLEGAHEGYVNAAAFSPDGARILTASDDGTARQWDAATGEPLPLVIRGHEGRIRAACYAPDGASILTCGSDKTARVWNAVNGAELMILRGHAWTVRCGAFDAAGRRIATGSDDNAAIVWNAADGQMVAKLAGHTGAVTAVALSPDGRRAVTGSEDSTVKLWDAETGKEILTLGAHDDEVTAVEFAPDGRTILSAARDGRTLLWDATAW